MTSVTDDFMQYEHMEGRTLVIDGAEFADTREKLEADARKLQGHIWQAGYEHRASDGERHIIELLDRQAAITERGMCAECEWPSLAAQPDQEAYDRIADLQSQLEEVSRAYKERGRIIAELREQLRNDDEPFCETVKRWLSEDAPEECIECEDGCWHDMHELMARECDDCGPMHAAESEIRELQKKYKNLLEYRTKVDCDCDCCNWQAERDRMRKVIETQAESFRKMETELSSMVKKYEEQKRRLFDKQQENANQREELARFNAVRRRTKRMPKACVWPRKDDGKLLKPGRDCMSIKFYRDHYDVDYGDGEHLWYSYEMAREDERAWMRGED